MHSRGQVVRKTVARGSKSEHDAVVLITGADELKLRRVGGNPFSDPALEQLVGKTIECEGEARDGTLVVTSWRVTTE